MACSLQLFESQDVGTSEESFFRFDWLGGSSILMGWSQAGRSGLRSGRRVQIVITDGLR